MYFPPPFIIFKQEVVFRGEILVQRMFECLLNQTHLNTTFQYLNSLISDFQSKSAIEIISDQDGAWTRNRERWVGALESRVLRCYLSPAAPAAGSPPSLAVSLAAPSLAPCLAITQGLIRAIAGNLTHCCSEVRTAGAKDYLYWAQIAGREEIAVREELSRTRRHNLHPL